MLSGRSGGESTRGLAERELRRHDLRRANPTGSGDLDGARVVLRHVGRAALESDLVLLQVGRGKVMGRAGTPTIITMPPFLASLMALSTVG